MPLKGETVTARHSETSSTGEDFTLSDESLEVTPPIGDSAEVTVTVDPGAATPAISHVLSAAVAFSVQGAYELKWQLTVGSDTRVRVEEYFCANTDIWSKTRELLNRSVSSLPDRILDPIYAGVMRFLQSMYPDCASDYPTMNLADAKCFEKALAFIAASRYANFHPDEFKSGPKTRVTQGPVTYQYGSPRFSTLPDSPEDLWLVEAYNSLNLISCQAERLAEFNDNLSLFGTAGPRAGVKTFQRVGINQLYVIASQEQLC